MKENFKELNELIKKEQEIRDMRKAFEGVTLFHFAKDALADYEFRIHESISSNFKLSFITAAHFKMQGMIELYNEREDGNLKNYLWLVCIEAFEAVYEMIQNPKKYENSNIPIDKEIFECLFATDRKLLNLAFTEDGKFNPSNVVSKELNAEGCLAFKMLLDMFNNLYSQYDLKRCVDV